MFLLPKFKIHTVLLYLTLTVSCISFAQVIKSNTVLEKVNEELLGYNAASALKIIDKQLLAQSLSVDTLAILKGLKVAAFVQKCMKKRYL